MSCVLGTLGALAFAVLSAHCAADTFTSAMDGSVDDSASGADGGDSASGADAGADNALPVVDSAAPCDAMETPLATVGVFVSGAMGNDPPTGDGSQLRPLKTIAEGLAASAASPTRKTVYLDEGSYNEAVVFSAAHAGITVRGGFKALGATWMRDCGARGLTLIKSPTAVGVAVSGTTVVAGLKELTVTTKASGASGADTAGESVYGITVTGDSTLFSLFAVDVIAGNGGVGGAATAGKTPPAPTVTCTTASDSAAGTDAPAAPSATAGDFSASGYAAGDGKAGVDGAPGHNGALGLAGSFASCTTQCTGCPMPVVINCACTNVGCCSCNPGSQVIAAVYTAAGPSGCGGAGAIGAKQGRGGGASVGLFVSGNATISVAYTALSGGIGGAGSAGGTSAPGAAGGAGTTSSASCNTGACTCSVDMFMETPHCGTNGSGASFSSASGTPGGSGGRSGAGGGGAGGPSYGVVTTGGALFVADPTVSIVPGLGGVGAGGAPTGESAPKLAL